MTNSSHNDGGRDELITENTQNPQVKRALLVDDIPGYLDLLELHLPTGLEAFRTSSFEEARALTEELSFAVALVDVRLSEEDHQNRDGLEFLRWLTSNVPALPVIMISAYREFEHELESLASGAECFLRKPIVPRELRREVERVVLGTTRSFEAGTAAPEDRNREAE